MGVGYRSTRDKVGVARQRANKLSSPKEPESLTIDDVVRMGNLQVSLKKNMKIPRADVNERKRIEFDLEQGRRVLEHNLSALKTALAHPEIVKDPKLRARLIVDKEEVRIVIKWEDRNQLG